jgi:hypothetical protein
MAEINQVFKALQEMRRETDLEAVTRQAQEDAEAARRRPRDCREDDGSG